MDEQIVGYQENRIELSHVVLNYDKNIKLLRGFEVDAKSNKRHMRNIVIMVGNEFVTSNIADSILLKEEFALFDRGDAQNKYLFPSDRTVEKERVNSLILKFADDNQIYITRSEAKAIVTLWNMSMHGYSFSRLLEFETKQTLETWTTLLENNGYLQLELEHEGH